MNDPGDEQPVFATGMTAEHPATPPTFTHAESYWTSADLSLEIAERRLALQLAFRRSEAAPTDESAVLEVARIATGIANALRAARG